MEDDALTLFVTDDGELVVREPWCDCIRHGKKVGHGYTKRSDGVWVRPCCMRPEKARWEKWGDKPVPPLNQ